MDDACAKTMMEKIIQAVSEVPEGELCALYDLVMDFRRTLEERGSRWADFTGIISEEDASDLFEEAGAACVKVDGVCRAAE